MHWLTPQLDALLATRESLPHALLLAGPPGIGKSAFANSLAQSLLCEAPASGGRACGRCPACGWFVSGNHPDVRRVSPDAESADEEGGTRTEAGRWIKIDQVRELAEFMMVGGHRAGRKIVIVDPADALNVPAANALLKTLEEPQGNALFLLVTGRPDALPATIRSRCVAFPLHAPSTEEALAWLEKQNGIESTEQARQLLAAAAGRPLRALALADPAQSQAYQVVIENVARMPELSSLRAAETLAAAPARAWVPLLQAWVADLARVAAGATPVRFPDQAARLSSLARTTSLDAISSYSAWLERQTRVLDHPLNARLLCEDVLLRYRQVFR